MIVHLLKIYSVNLTAATAIEYTLLAAGIAMAIAASLFVFGVDLDTMFDQMGATVEDANTVVDTFEAPQ